jgi:hypothetical protein
MGDIMKNKKHSPLYLTGVVILALMVIILAASLITCNPLFRGSDDSIPFNESYAYGSSKLDLFILDSYNELGQSNINEFYDWMSSAYSAWRDEAVASGSFPFKGQESHDLKSFCSWARNHFNEIKEPRVRAEEEQSISIELHRLIKTIIPKFSLERGYEFHNVVRSGERQCFLQSVLIASLLQSMDISAGLLMVFKNERGEESNNGHAVVLERLADGKDLLVDASESAPFATHQGLFCRTHEGYRYVLPQYNEKTGAILSYVSVSGKKIADRREVKTMDLSFIQSQFDVYRGEWTEGGFHDKNKSTQGMETAAGYFQRSVSECPENPQALYFLARSYEELGQSAYALETYAKAMKLYTHYGWVPRSMKDKEAKLHF